MPFAAAAEIVGRAKSLAEEMFEKIDTPYHDEDRQKPPPLQAHV